MTRTKRSTSSKIKAKAAAVAFLLASLGLLAGCQGVSAAGSGQQTGSLSLSATTLSFGSVPVGSSKTLTVSASNSGTKSVTVSSASVSTKYFTLSSPSLPLVLPAGSSETLSIKFTPNTSASFLANVALSSDAEQGVTNLSLTGSGVADGQLGLNPGSENFGSITVGSKQTQTVTLSNTGGTSVNISQATVSGTGFQLSGLITPLTLDASKSTTFTVAFSPQSAGAASGLVTITSDASSPSLTMGLAGTGVAPGSLAANPTSLSFGSVTVGGKQNISETVTNTGGASVSITQVATSGTGFSFTGITTPLTLTSGQSATFTVSFAPQSAGAASGNLTLTSNASNSTLSVPLSGTGTTATGTLTVSPTTLPLGNIVVGTSGTATGSLTASGASVTVTAASTNNSVFSVGGLSLPLTLSAGQSTNFTVTFSPTVTGAASATLTFTSNAQPSTTTETLTGTGMPAPVHSVGLSWNASTSSNISGYNVYRATYTTACGSYGKINSLLNTTTVYTDSNVVDGTSYCYAATAVNTSNQESGYSNIVSNVKIPAP